jgi:hypothetical protein
MIFEGHRIDTGDLPWYYLPKWLFIAHPLYLLAGVICGTATIVLIERKFKNSAVWMVLFSALFPIFFIVYNKSTLYDGLRHTLFTVPPMIIICTLFFIYVFDVLKNKGMRFAFAGVLIILIALPAKFMFANHPNEYVYFNEIAGGIKSAYGVYETDYYMNSIMQGYKWLLENELSKSKESAIVASNCAEPLVEYAKVSPIPFRPMYSRFYQKNQKEWDYAIYYGFEKRPGTQRLQGLYSYATKRPAKSA